MQLAPFALLVFLGRRRELRLERQRRSSPLEGTRHGRVGALVLVIVPVTAGLQFVGLNVNPGRLIVTLTSGSAVGCRR